MEYRLFDEIYREVASNSFRTEVVDDEEYIVPAHLGPEGRTHTHEDFLQNGGPHIFTIKAEELTDMDPEELRRIFSVRNILIKGSHLHDPWKWDKTSFEILAPLLQGISVQGKSYLSKPLCLP